MAILKLLGFLLGVIGPGMASNEFGDRTRQVGISIIELEKLLNDREHYSYLPSNEVLKNLPSKVSRSAAVLASRRFIDSTKTTSLVGDKLSALFVDLPTLKFSIETDQPVHYVLMRHRILEDSLNGIDGLEQVVILGSGFDTTSIRNSNNGIDFFEVDRPGVLHFKDSVLRQANIGALSNPIGIDVRNINDLKEVLRKTDPSKHTFIMAEGFFMYFDQEFIGEALSLIIEYYDRVSIGFDHLMPSYELDPNNKKVIDRLKKAGKESVKSFFNPDNIEEILDPQIWSIDTWTPTRLQKRYLNSNWTGRDDKYVAVIQPRSECP